MQLPSETELWLVEDDPHLLNVLEHAFTRAQWKVRPFRTTWEARRQLLTDSPSCVVADLRVGDDDGLALIEHVRETCWPASAVLMSGHLDPTLTVRALRGGVSMVFEKPFAIDAMCAEVGEALRQAEARIAETRRKGAARVAVESLTAGHRAVLELLVECRPHKQIASRLDIALRTVEKRKKEIYERLRVDTFTELLALLYLAEVPASRRATQLPNWA